MKPRIIQFTNGKYGVQVSRFPKKFKSIYSNRSFKLKDFAIDECQGTMEQCVDIYNNLVIKIDKHIYPNDKRNEI